MRATLKVTYTDNTTASVAAIPKDFIAWERKTKRLTSNLANGVGMEDMAYWAWHALFRSTTVTDPFDDWLDAVAEIEMEDEPDPKATPNARSKGSA
jgi:hypothetical protein